MNEDPKISSGDEALGYRDALRVAIAQLSQATDNLRSTQARCTELLDDSRAARRMLRKLASGVAGDSLLFAKALLEAEDFLG